MSWKLNTFAMALIGMIGVNLALGEQNAPWPDAAPQNHAPAVASDDTSMATATKKPSDQESIAKQKTCPVTDKPLGSMGKPVKVVVKGRTVFLCCAGCKSKLLANPDKYLKKLDEKK